MQSINNAHAGLKRIYWLLYFVTLNLTTLKYYIDHEQGHQYSLQLINLDDCNLKKNLSHFDTYAYISLSSSHPTSFFLRVMVFAKDPCKFPFVDKHIHNIIVYAQDAET